MARRGTKQEIATASVRLETEGADQVKRDLRGVQAETGKTTAGMKGMGESLEKSTEGQRKFAGAVSSSAGVLTSLVGAVTAVLGVFALFFTAGRKVGEVLFRIKSEASDVADALSAKLNKSLDETIALADKAGRAAFAERLKELRGEIAPLEKRQAGRQVTLEAAQDELNRFQDFLVDTGVDARTARPSVGRRLEQLRGAVQIEKEALQRLNDEMAALRQEMATLRRANEDRLRHEQRVRDNRAVQGHIDAFLRQQNRTLEAIERNTREGGRY